MTVNIKDKLPFGKYKNLTLLDIQEIDYKYYTWLRSQKWFKVSYN